MRESQPGEARRGFFQMKRTRHSTEQIIEKLRRADVSLGKGQAPRQNQYSAVLDW
jgi:hypothetical protein